MDKEYSAELEPYVEKHNISFATLSQQTRECFEFKLKSHFAACKPTEDGQDFIFCLATPGTIGLSNQNSRISPEEATALCETYPFFLASRIG